MRKKVLLVEDNPDHQFIVRTHLEVEGYRVLLADNGLKARELLAKENFNLIILDLWLPELDGVSLLKSIKTDPHLASIPVIVTSGTFKEPDDILPLKNMGVGEYFIKPYEPGELVEAVEQLIS